MNSSKKSRFDNRAQAGVSLMSVIVAMGIVAMLVPFFLDFANNTMNMANKQRIEADLEDIRMVIRGRFDCARTIAELTSAANTATTKVSCDSNLYVPVFSKSTTLTTLFNAWNSSAISADDKDWMGRYEMRVSCRRNPVIAPVEYALFFETRRAQQAKSSAKSKDPILGTEMNFMPLFVVPLCTFPLIP